MPDLLSSIVIFFEAVMYRCLCSRMQIAPASNKTVNYNLLTPTT